MHQFESPKATDRRAAVELISAQRDNSVPSHVRPPAMRCRRLSLPLLIALAACGGVACTPAPAPRVSGGYLTPEQVDAIIDRWPDRVRRQLITYVYAEQANRYVRACGKDPRRALPAARLSGEGFRLPARHGGDLSCALAEAGVYLLAERGQGAEVTTLVAVVAGAQVIEIEVERSAKGVVHQVYGLYAPATGQGLRLRPRPDRVVLALGDDAVVEQPVSGAESLNAIRALLGRASFDLSAVGIEVASVDRRASAGR